jgi:hypothetical protein
LIWPGEGISKYPIPKPSQSCSKSQGETNPLPIEMHVFELNYEAYNQSVLEMGILIMAHGFTDKKESSTFKQGKDKSVGHYQDRTGDFRISEHHVGT